MEMKMLLCKGVQCLSFFITIDWFQNIVWFLLDPVFLRFSIQNNIYCQNFLQKTFLTAYVKEHNMILSLFIKLQNTSKRLTRNLGNSKYFESQKLRPYIERSLRPSPWFFVKSVWFRFKVLHFSRDRMVQSRQIIILWEFSGFWEIRRLLNSDSKSAMHYIYYKHWIITKHN